MQKLNLSCLFSVLSVPSNIAFDLPESHMDLDFKPVGEIYRMLYENKF